MQILRKFKNPLYWIIGNTIKYLIRKTLFKNINNKDFSSLVGYVLELLPNQTLINILILIKDTLKSKPSELFKFNIWNQALIHTLPLENRVDIVNKESLKIKYLFIILALGNISKRLLFLFKNIILLPFKLGVYSFIAHLFGLRVEYFLSLFDILKFNLPSWTYNKLLELHISWMSWIKNIFQINSIRTETTTSNSNFSIPKIFTSKIEKEIPLTIESEPKPETYFYLTKTQWLYVSISILTALAAYLGYTGGIPFSKTIIESDPDSNISHTYNEDKGEGTSKGKGKESTYTFPITSKVDVNAKTWQDTFNEGGEKLLEKIKNSYIWIKNKFISSSSPSTDIPDIRDEVIRSTDEIILGLYEKKQLLEEQRWLEMLKKGEATPEEFNEWHSNKNQLNSIINKKTSPTLSDPDSSKEYEHLFPYGDSSKPKVSIPKSSIYSSDFNDSTETVTPKTARREIREDLSPDITSSEFTPLTHPSSDLDEHTYPPRPLRMDRSSRFSNLADQPFAQGYSDDIDPSEIHINKGSLLLSSRFVDSFKEEEDWNN